MQDIDLRSDTVTWPTPAMRKAMARARVGDDVYGEDPTVNELQEVAARRLGKEAGLFVVSGTMGNLVAILAHAERGDEAIVGEDAHTLQWEAGGMAALGGVIPLALPTDSEGRMDPQRIAASVRADDPHLPRSRLILLENSYAARGGVPLPPCYFSSVAEIAHRFHLKIHLDGARLWNAVVALERPAADLVRHVDSVSFCLSKGLCAPVGSVLCGTRAFIHRARRIRKILGGGLRQAGILAAAGLVALEQMVDRLADDHRRARRLARGLAAFPGLALDPDSVRTNIVYFHLEEQAPVSRSSFISRLKEAGFLLDAEGPRTLRAVTHHGLTDDHIDLFLAQAGRILAGPGA